MKIDIKNEKVTLFLFFKKSKKAKEIIKKEQ